ncbi:MAG TPA: hypothetical protein PK006_07520 [Saprospiraceae bacterium]|nr:hypothetical protein [Saprospiraceae bacterium]
MPKLHEPNRRPKLCQRACKANPKEKEISKNTPPHDRKTMKTTTTNRQINHDRQGSTGGNRHLAQWLVQWLIQGSTSHQLLWYVDSFVLRNPPLRQAPKRYSQW